MPTYKNKKTLKDVANLAGVSHTTVSLVVNDAGGSRVSDGTRRRVLDAIQTLNYKPNLTAKRLASGKMHAIGLYIPFKIPIQVCKSSSSTNQVNLSLKATGSWLGIWNPVSPS